jgi:type I restriction enzyme R subunit
MQAIARVNRTFRDKPGGLIVDYIGIAPNLRKALAEYSPSDRDQAGVPIEQMVAVMVEKHDVVTSMLHGMAWSSDPVLPADERLAQLWNVMDFVLSDLDRKARFLDQVLALTKAFALCGTRDDAMAIRDDVKLFADVRAAVAKLDHEGAGPRQPGNAEMDTAIAQLVSEAVASEGVIDVYAAAGIDNPELSILSDEFLDGLAKAERPNLQLALLRKLLDDEIRTRRPTNLVQAHKFSELLDDAIHRYTNRALSTAEIIAALVELAKDLRESKARAGELSLAVDELAFYDAICQNDAAVLEMGDDTLKTIAHALVHAVRESATIDWNLKESVQAGLRAKVKRLLARYDYPPDKDERAIELVLEQAQLFAEAEAA